LLALLLLLLTASSLATPAGFSTFFFSQHCPDGWYPLVTAQGRLIVSVADASHAGITVNFPLNDQEDRIHRHSYSTSLNLRSKSVAAINCCNNQGACNGDYHIDSTTDPGTSGYPFVQLLLCTLKIDTQDSVPFGTIAFFEPSMAACPSNWLPLEEANGRFLLPGFAEDGVLPSVAKPLESGEDRHHQHIFLTNITTTDVSYDGVDGCCNNNPAAADDYPIGGTTNNTSSELPYIQLLTCLSQEPTFSAKFPAETLLFNSVGCPPGWNSSIEAAGRFVVALPLGGEAGSTFGSASLRPAQTSSPLHKHTYSGSVETSSCGVGLASGCCGSGYVGNGKYSFRDTTDTSTLDLPFLSVPMCMQL